MNHFTVNPALPHPDSDGDPEPMQLADAITFALKILRDPNADMWARRKVADELSYSFECTVEDL